MRNLLSIRPGLALIWFAGIMVSQVSAQQNLSFAAVRSGVSVPVARYSSKSLDGGSFALPGLNITAEGAWFFHPNFGAGLSAGLNMNPVDVGVLGYEKVQADPFLQDVYIHAEPYNVATLMGGIYYQRPLAEKLNLTAKALAGLLYVKTPYMVSKPQYFQVGPTYEVITSAKDYKFSWLAGVGLSYELTPCYDLVFDTDFMYRETSFLFYTGGGTSTRTDIHIISMLNATVGVRFHLGSTGNTP